MQSQATIIMVKQLTMRQMRGALALTQEQMAKKCELHRVTYQKYENREAKKEPFPVMTFLAVKHFYEKEMSGANESEN